MKQINFISIRNILIFSFFIFSLSAWGKQTKLDKSVRIPQQEEIVSSIFKDMVVVQRKAKEKRNKILFSTYLQFDFSDGPITMYGLNTNFGYAFNDFFEVYLNLVPVFLSEERNIVDRVESLTLQGGGQATLTYAKPEYQYGIEALWLPAYGKDSWGPKQIVRSDTFFKFGAAQILYEDNETGLRFTSAIGKTYFISSYFNFRFAAGVSYLQTIVDAEKDFRTIGILEFGSVYYF